MSFCKLFLLVGACLLILSGCAIDVSPSSYIYQDAERMPLDTTALQHAVQKDKSAVSITTVNITNPQGLELSGVAVSYPKAIVNIVFYGGNGMTVNKASVILHRFGQIPANIIWVDYQGTGSSQKAPKIKVANMKSDALLVFDYAKDVFPDDTPVVVHGLSMGSLIATYVATERNVDGLVLDGALNSLPEVVENMVPIWSKPFTRLEIHPELANIDNGVLLEQYTGPLLLIVGEKDKLTPVEFSQQLYRLSASENKAVYVVPGARHEHAMKDEHTIDRYREFVQSL